MFFVLLVPAFSEITAIKAGSLVDPENGTAQKNVIILVEGTKIKAVGSGITIPQGAKVINLSNLTVLPGLIDSHTHLCAERALQGVVNAKSMLEAGFTCARDMGNAGNYADVALRRASDNEWSKIVGDYK